MKKTIPIMIRLLLTFMSIATLIMAFFWTPHLVLYANEITNSAIVTPSAYTLSSLITAIALTVFVISFSFPTAIEKESIFTLGIAKNVKLIALLILIDCLLFAIGTVLLFILGDRLLSPALAFVDVIGIAVSAMLLVLSEYLKEASYLKEEADCTL